jgi:hypothetical protein
MSAKTRQYVDFTVYPGKIVDDQYIFGPLYSESKTGAIRQWEFKIRVVKEINEANENVRELERDQNWSLLEDSIVPLSMEFLTKALSLDPSIGIAQYWTETGIVGKKISRSPPKYADEKNWGQANQRNALMTAIIIGNDEYETKIKAGFKTSKKLAKNSYGTVDTSDLNKLYYPMLAQDYEKSWQHIKFPVYVEPKLDGTRAIAYLCLTEEERKGLQSGDSSSLTYHNVIIHSRDLIVFPGLAQVKKQLLHVLINLFDVESGESIRLDGEFYRFGLKLQFITSIVRNEDKSNNLNENPVYFHIFDAFYPAKIDENNEQRRKYIKSIFVGKKVEKKVYTAKINNIKQHVNYVVDMIEMETKLAENNDSADVNLRGFESIEKAHEFKEYANSLIETPEKIQTPLSIAFYTWKWLTLIPRITIENRLDCEFLYQTVVSMKFEGIMLRNIAGKYLTTDNSPDSRRSKNLQKRKPTYIEEFVVVDYTCGKGANQNCIIWICEFKGKRFNVTPKHSNRQKNREVYLECENNMFDKKYKGRKISVEYEDKSDDGIPLRAKGVMFRDVNL